MSRARLGVRVAAAVGLLSVTRLVSAYPGDVFHTAAPVEAPSRPDGVAASDGAAVAADGAATYRIPITLPPGRVGQQPTLALAYSSRSPVRGGLAAGWELPIPRMGFDTSAGRLGATTYRSTLTGTRLIPVNEPGGAAGALHFRAEHDDGDTRYERSGDTWRALTTDGRILTFGGSPEARDTSAGAWAGREARWLLTRSVDRFGNEIIYTYRKVFARVWNGAMGQPTADIRLDRIEYGGNPQAGLGHHVRIDLEYAAALDLCPGSQVPIGAQFSYRSGIPLYLGAARLDAISIKVLGVGRSAGGGEAWSQRRRIALGYDTNELSCPRDLLHAPLRLLTRVTETGYGATGVTRTLPATTFEYGRRERDLGQRAPAMFSERLGWGRQQLDPAKPGGWPTIEMMTIDLDGDGLLDLVRSRGTADPSRCGYELGRNRGDGTFEFIQATLPTAPWAGATRNDGSERDRREGCNLAAQFTRRDLRPEQVVGGGYQSYRFMDVTGDGRVDLVTAIDAKGGAWRPAEDAALWPSGPPTCTGVGACVDDRGGRVACNPFATPIGLTSTSTTSDDDGGTGDDNWDACQWPNHGCPDPNCSAEQSCTCKDAYCSQGNVEQWALGSPYAPPEDSPLADFTSASDFFWSGPQAVAGFVGAEVEDPGRHHPRFSPLHEYRPEVVCGRYVLRVYVNDGRGRFDSAPRLVYSPIPLETDRPTSTLGAGPLAASSSWHGFLDLDGDGFLDAVFQRPDLVGADPRPTTFQVFRGDGTGAFTARADGTPYPWAAPALDGEWPRVHLRESSEPDHPGSVAPIYGRRHSETVVTLVDMNGDDLPDYVARSVWGASTPVRVFYNTGVGFESQAQAGTLQGYDPAGRALTTLDRSEQVVLGQYDNGELAAGFARAVLRQVDLDHDGLLDLVVLPEARDPDRNAWLSAAGPPPVRFYANVGDRLIDMGTPARAAPWWRGLARIQLTDSSYQWHLMTDFVDLDGDGLEEVFDNVYDRADDRDFLVDPGYGCDHDLDLGDIDWSKCGLGATALTDRKDGQGMRLLARVRDGGGGETRFAYAAVAPRAGGGRVPHPVWAVEQLVVNSGLVVAGVAAPDQVARYEYRRPVYNQEAIDRSRCVGASCSTADQPWGFRGFEEVAVTAPSGEHTVTTYAYDQFHGGLAVDVAVHDAPGGRLHTTTATTWQRLALFGGAIARWAPQVRTHRVCGASQSESSCRATGALRQERFQYTAQVPTSPAGATPIAYVASATIVAEGEAGPAFRADHATFAAYYGVNTYRILPATESRYEYAGATAIPIGSTQHGYDPQGLVETSTTQYAAAGKVAVTQRAYDLATGNLTEVWRPKLAGTTRRTRHTHDGHKMFIDTTTNELGQVVRTATDLATGAVTATRGPNRKTCSGACESWDGQPVTWDGERLVQDPLGRPLERSVMVDDPVAGYRAELVQRWSYVDAALGQPRREIRASRIDVGGDRWVTDEVELDGLGRVTRTIARNPDGADAVTTYTFDARGVLVAVDTPLPAARDGATVRDTITRDSHGRVLAVLRADGTGTRSGYDGLRTTTQEAAPDGAPAATTVTVRDVHGRLREVHERRGDGAVAITRYEPDGNDRPRRITDAAGAITELTHDWLGRREVVRRGGRTWRYTYDADGMLTTIGAPAPAGAAPAAWTTSIVYDDLDRPISRAAGVRDLTAAERTELAVGPITWTYDQGANGVGRLARASASGGTRTFTYDAGGRAIEQGESVALPGIPVRETRRQRRSYDALGNVTAAWYGDGVGARPETLVSFATDRRGRPEAARWLGGAGQPELAHLRRTTAGLIHERVDGLAPTSAAVLRRGHDDRGRPTSFAIDGLAAGARVLRAEQTFTWTDAGDLETMTSALAPASTVVRDAWSFAHDDRHQLTAATGPDGYAATFAYDAAGKLAAASIVADVPGVATRDVAYRYAAADPHAVSALIDSGSGAPWATYDHDPSGNVVARGRGGARSVHRYDGEDLQRVVVAPDGRREVYHYDEARQRRFIASYSAAGTLERLRWVFGDTELEYAPSGAVVRTDVHVALDGPVARVRDGATVALLFHNPQGHLIAALDRQGGLVAGYAYTPFGEVLEQVGTAPGSFDRTFNGKPADEISDLAYYGHRYYDPLSLTWTQADPLYRFVPETMAAAPRRANLYSFALQNPLRYVDRDGLEGDGLFDTLAGGVSDAFGGAKKAVVEKVEALADHVTSGKILLGPVGEVGGQIKSGLDDPQTYIEDSTLQFAGTLSERFGYMISLWNVGKATWDDGAYGFGHATVDEAWGIGTEHLATKAGGGVEPAHHEAKEHAEKRRRAPSATEAKAVSSAAATMLSTNAAHLARASVQAAQVTAWKARMLESVRW